MDRDARIFVARRSLVLVQISKEDKMTTEEKAQCLQAVVAYYIEIQGDDWRDYIKFDAQRLNLTESDRQKLVDFITEMGNGLIEDGIVDY
jgi:predicted component of type VI protein secretion system